MSLIFEKPEPKNEETAFDDIEDSRYFVFTDDFGDKILACKNGDYLVYLEDSGCHTPYSPSIFFSEPTRVGPFYDLKYVNKIDFVIKETI